MFSFLKKKINKFIPVNRSVKKPGKSLKVTGVKVEYGSPDVYLPQVRIGSSLDAAIDTVAAMNRRIYETGISPTLSLSRVSDFEFFITAKEDDESLMSQTLLLISMLDEAMLLIDSLAGEPYYRLNRNFLDNIYPVILDEYIYLKSKLTYE